MNFSIWEKHYTAKADIIIIGNGIVGLQCAIHLKTKYPKRRVWVVDRAPFSLGASMRNAGFACFGSAGELLDEIERTSENAAFELFARRFTGLKYLMEDFGEMECGYEKTGGYEIFEQHEKAESERILGEIPRLNSALNAVTGDDAFTIKSTRNFGMNVLENGILSSREGALQTDLLYSRIRAKASSLGVEIYSGIEIAKMESNELNYWKLITQTGQVLECKRLVICTNGFTQKLLPEIEVKPARGQVLVTSQLPALQWRGIMHACKGYYYFRSLGTRILIGGARHLAVDEETSFEPEINENLQNELMRFLKDVVIPKTEFEVEHRWAGIMGMAENRNPVVKEHLPGMYLCVRMGGMGVALSALVSRNLAALVEGL